MHYEATLAIAYLLLTFLQTTKLRNQADSPAEICKVLAILLLHVFQLYENNMEPRTLGHVFQLYENNMEPRTLPNFLLIRFIAGIPFGRFF